MNMFYLNCKNCIVLQNKLVFFYIYLINLNIAIKPICFNCKFLFVNKILNVNINSFIHSAKR